MKSVFIWKFVIPFSPEKGYSLMLKYSQYLYWFPYSKDADYLLAYDFLRENLIMVHISDKAQVDRYLEANNLVEKPRLADRLECLGYIVSDHLDEIEPVEALFSRGKWTNNVLFIVIAATTACNLKCTYCLQAGLSPLRMKEDTFAKTFSWIENQLITSGAQELNISMFGGEPLVDIKNFNRVIGSAQELCHRYEKKFTFSVTTNGTLIDRMNLPRLVAQGLSAIQFTLDGPREIHDKRRMHKNGAGTFDEIIHAIHKVKDTCPEILVRLEVNFDHGNADRIGDLVTELKADGLDRFVELSPEPILPAINNLLTEKRKPN